MDTKIVTVAGSPSSGKTLTCMKMAAALEKQKKNVIVILCDPFVPVIPYLVAADTPHETSLGTLLTSPALIQNQILSACVPMSEHISLLGYKNGENLTGFPKITKDKIISFFVMLRYLADMIIVDCSALFEADPTSIVAMEQAESMLYLSTADLKGISYHRTHEHMLKRSGITGKRYLGIGCYKVGQEWEAVAASLGGVDYVFPYTSEAEQQLNEVRILNNLTEKESIPYRNEIQKAVRDIFAVEPIEAQSKLQKQNLKSKNPPLQNMPQSGSGNKKNFWIPFGGNKGEF